MVIKGLQRSSRLIKKDELCSIAERTSLPNILWEIECSASSGYFSTVILNKSLNKTIVDRLLSMGLVLERDTDTTTLISWK